MDFSLITPERVIHDSIHVQSVTLPTQDGEITVLPGHMRLVSLLKAGEVRIVTEEGEEAFFAVDGGFVEITSMSVTIFADTAERAAEIDVVAAEEAVRRARQLMQEKRHTVGDLALLSARLERELARLKVGRRYRHIATS